MNECWINVYAHGKTIIYGLPHSYEYSCPNNLILIYRIHVKLK